MRILGVLLLALALIALLPLGFVLSWGAEGLSLDLRLGALRFRVFPSRRAGRRGSGGGGAASGKKKKRKTSGGASGIGLRDLPELAELALDALGRFRRRARIDELTLHLVFGGANGDGTVLLYGGINALLSSLLPAFHRAFRVRREDIQTAMDFELDRNICELRVAAVWRIGSLVRILFAAGLAFLRWRRGRRARQISAAADAGAGHG